MLFKEYFQKALKSCLYFFSAAALIGILIQLNVRLQPWAIGLVSVFCWISVVIFFVYFFYHLFVNRLKGWTTLGIAWDLVTIGGAAISLSNIRLAASLVVFRNLFHLIKRSTSLAATRVFFRHLRDNPALLISLSFLSIIFVGTALLLLPVATPELKGLPFVDALFIITSATCVTGLNTIDISTQLSMFGQIVVLVAIQLGGLGIMTMSVSLLIGMGKRLSLKDRVVMQDIVDEGDYDEFRRILRGILKWTFLTEFLGAVILAVRWHFDFGGVAKAAYFGVFHSVSAFCNAGFSLFSDNLVGYQSDPTVNLTISGLLIMGGLGYVIAMGLIPGPKFLKTTHVKLTLLVTLALILVGWSLIFLFEYSNSMLDMPLGTKLLVSWFQAVTPRTAGFTTIDLATFARPTIFLTCILMFIGACPGSTGGGIKTTTFGILVLTVRSYFKRRDSVEVFGRRIPDESVKKAISITFLAVSFIALALTFLFFTEYESVEDIIFEAISAFGTVGLSLNLTPKLTVAGKLIITCLMFVGRVGPLTIAFLIGRPFVKGHYTLPVARVMVG